MVGQSPILPFVSPGVPSARCSIWRKAAPGTFWLACVYRTLSKPLIFLICLLGLSLAPALQSAEVTATLSKESVPAGEGANLTIRITNGNATALNAPDVPNLILNGPSQGRQVSVINGVTTSSTTLSYAVGSMTPGEYQIPPFSITVDGVEMQTQAFKLTVTPSAAGAPAGLTPGSNPGQPAAPAPEAGDKNFGFLTVAFAGKDRKHAWVGEIAPVRIQAWLPADTRVSLNSPLQPQGSAFTLHNLSDQPQQETQIQNGKRYTVVTWYGGLSATKAGTSPPDLGMKISVQVPDPANRRQSVGDPFFDQFLGRAMIQKEVELQSKTDESANLEIRPLPAEGRPGDFDGAVGKFAFGRTTIPTTWKTGEPQQIAAEVQGEGNFNLLKQPTLKSNHDWKSYDGQSTFAARDAASFSGQTTWRFSQVPRQAGPQQVQLAFSYFDPDLASYQTVETPPQSINVNGADLPADTEAPVRESLPPATPPPPALAPQRVREGFGTSLTPLAWRTSFRRLLGLCGAGVLVGLILPPLLLRLRDPQRLARERAASELKKAMQEAVSYSYRGDVPGFFAAARRALQIRLAARCQRPAPSITLADVTRQLPSDSPVIGIFREADRLEYSRTESLPSAELPAWRTRLEQALTSLTT